MLKWKMRHSTMRAVLKGAQLRVRTVLRHDQPSLLNLGQILPNNSSTIGRPISGTWAVRLLHVTVFISRPIRVASVEQQLVGLVRSMSRAIKTKSVHLAHLRQTVYCLLRIRLRLPSTCRVMNRLLLKFWKMQPMRKATERG